MEKDQITKILEKMPFKEGVFLKGEVMIDLQNGILIKKIKKTTLRLIKHVNVYETEVIKTENVEITEEGEKKTLFLLLTIKMAQQVLIFLV